MVTTPVAVHRDQTAPPARDRLASPGHVQTVPPLTAGGRRGRRAPDAGAPLTTAGGALRCPC
jgi:hypothetical protein